MCGIGGIINDSYHPIKIFNDELYHRGPDHANIYHNGVLSFGHTRLSILDLTEAGNQPLFTDRFVLTYNGEIYNYKDLNYHGGNDAYTFLHYIDGYGQVDEALRDANGMYAFAIYDKLKQELHLAVDKLGQKPLYYTQIGKSFAFASSPNALLPLKEKWSISTQALKSYWKLGSVMHNSIWGGIKKLNAGEHLKYNIKSGQVITEIYWQPQYQSNVKEIEDLIYDAINKVKVADVPIHIFLSGGVDSSLVASQFIAGNAIHLKSPEIIYAAQVAVKFDIRLRNVTPEDCEPIEAMRDYARKCGEPSMAALIPWITAREAAKFGKVAISANGADELFFGYDRTSQKITRIQLDHIFRSCVDYEIYRPEIDNRLSSGRWLELMTYVQHDLNKTLDFASMAHSLEVRSPFLDHRLVEAALSIPQEKIGRKQILKNMLQRMGFSREFTDRPKMGFSLYTPVPNLNELQTEAYQWCLNEKYLQLMHEPNKRDLMYLKASAFGFKQWWEVWKNKIG